MSQTTSSNGGVLVEQGQQQDEKPVSCHTQLPLFPLDNNTIQGTTGIPRRHVPINIKLVHQASARASELARSRSRWESGTYLFSGSRSTISAHGLFARTHRPTHYFQEPREIPI